MRNCIPNFWEREWEWKIHSQLSGTGMGGWYSRDWSGTGIPAHPWARLRRTADQIPVKWSSQPMSGKQTGSTFCWSSTILIVANRSGPTIVRTKRANSERRLWPTWELLGPSIPGPILAFFPMSRVLPSMPLLPSFHKWEHYWTYDRDGFGGHEIYGFHQTFIPAFNSTTARVERPDSEGRRIESKKSEILNLWAENKPGQHSVDRPPS